MDRSEKERVVAELTDRLKESETLIVADYRGLTVTAIDELRTKLLEHGARFSVVKNTLTRRAAEAAGIDALLALLEGPSAIAFLDTGGDPVAVAKALDEAARSEILVIKGGLLEGSQIAADDVRQLAKLPPTDALRAQLVRALAGSLTTIVGLFAAPMRELVGVIDARIRQLEERGETGEPAAEEPVADEPQAEEPKAEAEAASGDEPEAPSEPAEAEADRTPDEASPEPENPDDVPQGEGEEQ